MKLFARAAIAATLVLAVGCSGPAKKADPPKKADAAKKGDAKKADAKKPALKADKGVDVATKTIRIGTLNDESGPAATIGKPYALGKRILAKQINAGKSGLLPDGWKVELVEKDHGYNPGKSEQSFKEIKDNVLFFGTSFGTPNTLPLRPFLKADNVVAYPASLSSQMAEFVHTPPAGPNYSLESRRAMDWVVETAGGADKVKAGIVYQQDDYGKDGHAGWKQAAAQHKVTIAAEQTVAPGQKDFTAVITALKGAGATHVLLTVLPSSTGPLLGTAAKMGFGPTWIGNTPAWIDAFFAHPKLPAPVFANFHLVQGSPFWGEQVKGMPAFLETFKAHGGGARPDSYILLSYGQGRGAIEAARKAIEAGDITRAGYLKALQGIKGYDAGGLFQPVDFTKFPYAASTETRVLKPDFEKKTWNVVAPYADPKAAAAPAPATTAKAAPGQPG